MVETYEHYDGVKLKIADGLVDAPAVENMVTDPQIKSVQLTVVLETQSLFIDTLTCQHINNDLIKFDRAKRRMLSFPNLSGRSSCLNTVARAVD